MPDIASITVIVGTWIAKKVATPLLTSIATDQLRDRAAKWLATYSNHDIPKALARAWTRAIDATFEDYINAPPHDLSSGHTDAIRAFAREITHPSRTAAMFPPDVLGDPMAELQTNPAAVFAVGTLDVQRRLTELMDNELALINPPPRLPESFVAHVQERLSTSLLFFFVEIAVKEDEKASRQTMFAAGVETLKRLFDIKDSLDWLHRKIDVIGVDAQRGADAAIEARDGVRDLSRRLDGRIRPAVTPNTVPPVSRTFIPRTAITQKIHEALNGSEHPTATGADAGTLRRAFASAWGGSGKTVAAILYAHQYADHYPAGRLFLSMETADPARPIGLLAPHLGFDPSKNPADDAPRVRAALEHATDADGSPMASLLVLDNVDDETHWDAILRSGAVPRGACRVLVTTRSEKIGTAGQVVKVTRLTDDEAHELLKGFSDAVTRDAPEMAIASEINVWLGGLAVAVAAVAARMSLMADVSWADYWARLKNLRTEDLPDVREDVRRELGIDGVGDARGLAEHKRTLHVIDGAFDALAERGLLAERRAVEYAALLPQDMAPASWLVALLEADAERERDEDGTPDPLAIAFDTAADDPRSPARAVLAHLAALDVLLPVGEDGKLLGLHRLWHARVRERSGGDTQRTGVLWDAITGHAVVRAMAIVAGDDGNGNGTIDNPAVLTDKALRWELAPLAGVCAALWAAGRPGDAARVGGWLGTTAMQLGRLVEARDCLSPVVQHESAVEAAIGHELLASCLSNLALVLQDLGDLPGARTRMERAIEIETKHFDGDHPTLATSYSNLATILRDLGDLAGARNRMERAIEIDEKHFDADHPMLATSYNNLAHICFAEGDRAQACANWHRALGILLKRFGEDHPHVKITRQSMAQAGCGQG